MPSLSPHETSLPRSIAVIGGGITGLAAAHRVVELSPDCGVALYEAGDRLGGVLRTTREAGYLLEHCADNFITNQPEAVALCQRVGLEGELLSTLPERRGAEVVCRGQLHRVPEGFMLMAPHDAWQVLKTPLLSWRGKLRLLCECLVPRRAASLADESLASFAVRRLGREAFERLVQPLVSGIYTADANQLSMAAALTRFWDMEREHGSLMRAVWRQRRNSADGESAGSGARYSLFMTLREGMQQLIDRLADSLPAGAARLNTPVSGIEREGDRWRLRLASGETVTHDAVIVAISTIQAAALLRDIDVALAEELSGVPYAGAVLVLAGYRLDQIGRPLRSFGFVVPEIERREILAASYSSLKFPGRAPEGRILIRVFLGGAMHPEQLDLDDAEVRRIVLRELGELLGVQGEPELFRVLRWRGAMPQYHVGHAERVQRIEAHVQQLPGLALAGNAYHGVGIPQCIASGERAAERMLAALGNQAAHLA